MSNNHTPGPWHTQKSDHPGGLLIKPIPGQVVAQCDQVPEMKANAKLLAAAPDLLKALQLMIKACPHGADIANRIYAEHQAKEAIKKATE